MIQDKQEIEAELFTQEPIYSLFWDLGAQLKF